MKIVRVSSLGCPSCIIMNKRFNEIKDKYSFEYEEYDYDFDDIKEFDVGNILPVYIIYNNNVEVGRLCGEHKVEEFESIIEGIK